MPGNMWYSSAVGIGSGMATLGHVVVGLAAGRHHAPPQRSPLPAMALFTALSLVPDLDVLAIEISIPWRSPLAHRGALHSLPVAVLVSLAAAALGPALGRSRLRTFATALVAMGSHGLLDAMTDGGLGIALLWPFSRARFFFPWTPIRVAPIGLRFVSARGLVVLAQEACLFAPLMLYALWPRRRPDPEARPA